MDSNNQGQVSFQDRYKRSSQGIEQHRAPQQVHKPWQECQMGCNLIASVMFWKKMIENTSMDYFYENCRHQLTRITILNDLKKA